MQIVYSAVSSVPLMFIEAHEGIFSHVSGEVAILGSQFMIHIRHEPTIIFCQGFGISIEDKYMQWFTSLPVEIFLFLDKKEQIISAHKLLVEFTEDHSVTLQRLQTIQTFYEKQLAYLNNLLMPGLTNIEFWKILFNQK